MKVLGIGESVVDNAYIGDSNHTEKHVGGPSLIAMILLSRLGIDCTLMTTLGRDEEAKIVKKALKHDAVKVIAKLQKKTKVNNYVINPGDGSRQKIRGDVVHPFIKHLDRNFIRHFDVIIIDRHEKLAFSEILEKKKSTAKVIIDPSTEVSDFTFDMIRYSDYPIIPIESLTKIGGKKNLLACLKMLYAIAQKTIIVTAGELGSIVYNGENVELIPALHVQAVDVQGAGDVYRGAFAYGILQGWEIEDCAQYANKIAALQCTRIGNAAAIPTKKEIELCNNLFVSKKPISLPVVTDYFSKLYQTL